ncbi:hypothetical protein HYFRA_00005337 [Hymenoscyphus fraxineus]|uniref:Ubiquitin-like protease family profile domain-containing protein n=1 Tax=Hymenoscyphus fraxineus TaxID=746836 RepID=A0A9N9LDH6_9HELO|nr:hypothetical protein HYFRA_00005337 [Hymenoscyphus fraxineus]
MIRQRCSCREHRVIDQSYGMTTWSESLKRNQEEIGALTEGRARAIAPEMRHRCTIREHRYFVLDNSPSNILGYSEGVGLGIEDKDSKRKPKSLEDRNNDDDDDNDGFRKPPNTKRIKTTKAPDPNSSTKQPASSKAYAGVDVAKNNPVLLYGDSNNEEEYTVKIEYGGASLTERYLGTLEDFGWVGSFVIDTWFESLMYRLRQKDLKKAGRILILAPEWYQSLNVSRKRDYLSFDYIVAPIPEMSHWYLAIICNTNKLVDDTATISGFQPNDPTQPCIIIMDSLGWSHKDAFARITQWVVTMLKAKRGVDVDPKHIRTIQPMANLPRQMDSWNCGLFTIKYFTEFLRDPEGLLGRTIKNESLGFVFGQPEADFMRTVLRTGFRRIFAMKEEAKKEEANKKGKIPREEALNALVRSQEQKMMDEMAEEIEKGTNDESPYLEPEKRKRVTRTRQRTEALLDEAERAQLQTGKPKKELVKNLITPVDGDSGSENDKPQVVKTAPGRSSSDGSTEALLDEAERAQLQAGKPKKEVVIDLVTPVDGDSGSENDKPQVVKTAPGRSRSDGSTESKKNKSQVSRTSPKLTQSVSSESVWVGNGMAEIRIKDLETLGDGAWLNDEVVNFWNGVLRHRLVRRDPKLADSIHLTTLQFWGIWEGRPIDKDLPVPSSWLVPAPGTTTGELKRLPADFIITRDYIVLPIHDVNHFYVAVICNIKDLMNDDLRAVKKRPYRDPAHPWIIILDSFQSSRKIAVERLRSWLVKSVKVNRGKEIDPSRIHSMVAMNLPEQLDGFNCGLYALKYFERFLHNPADMIASILRNKSPGFLFGAKEADRMRVKLRSCFESILHMRKEALEKHSSIKANDDKILDVLERTAKELELDEDE